jgi:hypothetical protein
VNGGNSRRGDHLLLQSSIADTAKNAQKFLNINIHWQNPLFFSSLGRIRITDQIDAELGGLPEQLSGTMLYGDGNFFPSADHFLSENSV